MKNTIVCPFCKMVVLVIGGEIQEHCSLPFVPCANSGKIIDYSFMEKLTKELEETESK